MGYKDFHVHTNFSDGGNTPEEMVISAIEKGLTDIGFTDHSYTFFDESYCIQKDKIEAYRTEILRLKEKYKDKINVLCGIEQDYYSDTPTNMYDYVIGSVHYLKKDGVYFPTDETAEILKDAAKEHFNGDMYALCEEYFKTTADVVRKTGANIIGHFDLITKFQDKTPLFDTNNERYKTAWKKAADCLLKTDAVFEINTGAISRGYTKKPYPSDEIVQYIKSHGGKIILSSDSHRADTLCFMFDEIEL